MRDSIPGYDFRNPPPRTPQWAYSYYRTIRAHYKDYRRRRALRDSAVVELSVRKRRPVHALTDSELWDAARREAERDLERAIKDWRSNQVSHRRAQRRGEAF